ncbi:MAG: sulfotransferase [Pseudohongiellaceae bacterium]
MSVEQAKAALQGGDPAGAARLAGEALKQTPESTDALYVRAVALRYLDQYEEARQTLDRLKSLRPGYGRAWQEEGHLKSRYGETDGAIHAYEEAISHNPALTASWHALASLYRSQNRAGEAQRAQAQFQRLSGLPRELVSVASFMHEGKLYKAERLCRAFLQKHPHHPEAMRLLANLGVKLHVLDDAEFLLESALEFQPDFVIARVDYVDVLQRRQRYQRALEEARKLCDMDPKNPAFQSLYANQCMSVGDYDEALTIYDRVLKEMPDNSQVYLVQGHALKTVGRQQDAITAYHEAARHRPWFGDAWWSLANLKTYTFTDAEIQTMREQEASAGIPLADRYHLCFALGKALEDRAEWTESFEYYRRGNDMKRQETRYSTERTEKEFRLQRETCTPALFEKYRDAGHPAPDPIFIVGLPRAGSTLLEQILASHSRVDGTLELPNIMALAHRLDGRRRVDDEPRYPGILSELPAGKLAAFGQQYLDDTAIYREGAAFFTDKMPNNFRHIGLIHLILPNAKIIDARRHPMACCFSGFKQLFAEGQEFTYGLEQMGHYYRGYVELMDHWDRVLPGRILRVHHEDVVEDLETQVRRLLEFCGLEFEPACLDFHRTERVVRTASSEQVRQPINKEGLEQWRHYEPWLDPLKKALGPVLDAY